MDPLDQLLVEEDKDDIKRQVEELSLVLQNRYSLAAEKFKETIVNKLRGGEIDESEDIMKWLALSEALSDYQ
jgi:superfamily I DNA and RNA helicase